MRRWLTRAFVLISVPAFLALVIPSVAAAVATGGGGELGGDDQYAEGELLGDGSGAEISAEETAIDLGEPTTARPGGGDVTCRWFELEGQAESAGAPLDWSLLTNPPAELVGQTVSVLRICDDGGTYSEAEIVGFTLPVNGPPTVDPRRLALMARGRLPFPLPDVAFSPPLDSAEDFLLTQLPTWIWVENWAPASRTASAGGVVATVTATPVRQAWDFSPGRHDPETEGGCLGPGTRYDASQPLEAQSTACSFTFKRSSAAEPGAAYEGQLTVFYEITWSSNIGAGGSLGVVPRTTVMPVRVGEQQALNESGGNEQ